MAGIKDLILAADDIPYEDVDVSEWGVKVRVRGLNGADRDSYEAKIGAVRAAGKSVAEIEGAMKNFRSRYLVKCLCDPDSDMRIFADSEANQLGGKSGAVVDRLFDVARGLSGMTEESKADAEGNSEAAPSGSSTTD